MRAPSGLWVDSRYADIPILTCFLHIFAIVDQHACKHLSWMGRTVFHAVDMTYSMDRTYSSDRLSHRLTRTSTCCVSVSRWGAYYPLAWTLSASQVFAVSFPSSRTRTRHGHAIPNPPKFDEIH